MKKSGGDGDDDAGSDECVKFGKRLVGRHRFTHDKSDPAEMTNARPHRTTKVPFVWETKQKKTENQDPHDDDDAEDN